MRRLLPIAAFMVSALLPLTATAQSPLNPKLELAAGYAQVRGAQPNHESPPGVFVSLEGNYGRWLAAVGEFSATVATRQPRFFGDPEAGMSAYFAGPRVILRRLPHVAAFGQVLVGTAVSGDPDKGGYPSVGVQPGGGIEIHVRKHVGLRIGADRRHLLGIRGAAGSTSSIGILRAGLALF